MLQKDTKVNILGNILNTSGNLLSGTQCINSSLYQSWKWQQISPSAANE